MKMRRDNPLDLNKIFPDYIEKNTFRVGILLMILLFGFTLWSNDWEYKFSYAYCPEGTGDGCLVATGETVYNDVTGIPEQEYIHLFPDSYHGTPPNNHAKRFNSRALFIVLFSFMINHFYHFLVTRKFIPRVDKKELKKLKSFLEGGKKR
jgi:hypothetical protein